VFPTGTRMAEAEVRRIIWRSADVARVFVMGMIFLFLWRFFWMVHSAVFIVMLAILIAIVIHVPARRLERLGVPFRIALPFVVVLFVGALVGLMVAMVPELMAQVRLLATQLPETLDNAQAWFRQQTGQGPESQLSRTLSAQVSSFVSRFVPLAFNAITTLLGSFAIIVLATFFAAQPEIYRDLLLRFTPIETRHRWRQVYDEAGSNLQRWTIGKAITMLGIGVVTYVGLTLFKIPGALALASFAALMEFIPNFGPTIAAAPAVVAAFAISPRTALYVALFYFLLQQVQNAITVPLVERRAVSIPPAMLLVWQLMLAVGFGLLALFVATPLLAVLAVAVRILYLEPAEERHTWNRREGETAVPPSAPDSQPPHTPPVAEGA
ncbi:MAG TPA: AI-2E family transporter, partial [Longimicrobium sp.]|nr:AI-2E family transporter [Longimicrobium sp.]